MFAQFLLQIANAVRSQFAIGITNCQCIGKNDAVVKYSLPENNRQIFASQYELYLPTEQQLIAEMKKEIERLSDL